VSAEQRQEVPGYLYRGRLDGEGDQRSVVEWAMPDLIATVCPEAVSLVVELWSSEFDLTLRSVIDPDGNDLAHRFDAIATRMLAQAIGHDIDLWLEHVWKQPADDRERVSARYNRLWQWTRANGLAPLGPHLDYIWKD
jgi:hypothetical protein